MVTYERQVFMRACAGCVRFIAGASAAPRCLALARGENESGRRERGAASKRQTTIESEKWRQSKSQHGDSMAEKQWQLAGSWRLEEKAQYMLMSKACNEKRGGSVSLAWQASLSA